MRSSPAYRIFQKYGNIMLRLARAISGSDDRAVAAVIDVCREAAADHEGMPLWYQVMARTRTRARTDRSDLTPLASPVYRPDAESVPVTHVIIQDAFRAIDISDQNTLWRTLLGRDESDEEGLAQALRHLGAALASQSIPDLGEVE